MTALKMSNPSHISPQSPSKRVSSVRAQHAIDPRVALARLYQVQRLQREEALRLHPEARQYVPRQVPPFTVGVAREILTFFIRMDLYDDAASPNVYAMLELPGVERDTLILKVQGNKLIVHGERASPLSKKLQPATNQDTSCTPENFTVRELKFGSFHRELEIPAGVDVSLVLLCPGEFALTASIL